MINLPIHKIIFVLSIWIKNDNLLVAKAYNWWENSGLIVIISRCLKITSRCDSQDLNLKVRQCCHESCRFHVFTTSVSMLDNDPKKEDNPQCHHQIYAWQFENINTKPKENSIWPSAGWENTICKELTDANCLKVSSLELNVELVSKYLVLKTRQTQYNMTTMCC